MNNNTKEKNVNQRNRELFWFVLYILEQTSEMQNMVFMPLEETI